MEVGGGTTFHPCNITDDAGVEAAHGEPSTSHGIRGEAGGGAAA